ncbi:MAG: alpha/beta hydrolase [Patescibacteria group bacterium]
MSKIFILHGWTYQTETWRSLREMLKERGLEAEFLLIPGLTDGTNPIWTLDDYVEWLRSRTAEYGKVILIGHSNGGRISLAFAEKYPEKVERLILEDSAGIPAMGLRALKRDVFKVIAKIGGAVTKSEVLRKVLHKVARESDYQRATPEMRRTMANLGSVDLGPIFQRIKAPTLIIWGEKDTTTPLASGKIMHEKIRGSRMVVIEGARHSPHITHTKEVADLITEELTRP